MASQIALDPSTGDLAKGPGGFYSVSGVEQIRQHLWIRLQVIRGEIVWDVDSGLPMFEEISVIGTPPERLGAIFRETILGTPGVVEIEEDPRLTLDDNGLLVVSFRARADGGTIDFSEPITSKPLQEAA